MHNVRPMERHPRYRVWTVALVLVIAGAGCAGSRPPDQRPSVDCEPLPVISVAGCDAVVFPETLGWVEGFAHGEITSYWTPTTSEVLDLEDSLRSYLKQAAPQLETRIGEYRRQYTGFYHEGKRLMFVNFACDGPWSRGWQCRPVVVDDGGDCFFSLRCDPETSQCSSLWINGEA